jgi:hypothetical protein
MKLLKNLWWSWQLRQTLKDKSDSLTFASPAVLVREKHSMYKLGECKITIFDTKHDRDASLVNFEASALQYKQKIEKEKIAAAQDQFLAAPGIEMVSNFEPKPLQMSFKRMKMGYISNEEDNRKK